MALGETTIMNEEMVTLKGYAKQGCFFFNLFFKVFRGGPMKVLSVPYEIPFSCLAIRVSLHGFWRRGG